MQIMTIPVSRTGRDCLLMNIKNNFYTLVDFSSMGFGIMETNEMKYDLSIVSICEKFATNGLGNLETAFSRCMFAGEPAKLIFDVIPAHITVLRLLMLKASP
jgi:hypothetical protein